MARRSFIPRFHLQAAPPDQPRTTQDVASVSSALRGLTSDVGFACLLCALLLPAVIPCPLNGQTSSITALRQSDCCFEFTVNNQNPNGTPASVISLKTAMPGARILPTATAPSPWIATYAGTTKVEFQSAVPIPNGQSLGNFVVCFNAAGPVIPVSWVIANGLDLIASGTLLLKCRDGCDAVLFDSTSTCCSLMTYLNGNTAGRPINRIRMDIATGGFAWTSPRFRPADWSGTRQTNRSLMYSTTAAPIGPGEWLSGFGPCLYRFEGAPTVAKVVWTTMEDTVVLCRDTIDVECTEDPEPCDSVSVASAPGSCCFEAALHTRAQYSFINGLHLTILTPGVTFTGTPGSAWDVSTSTSQDVIFTTATSPLTSIQSLGGFTFCLSVPPTVTGPVSVAWKSLLNGIIVCSGMLDVTCKSTPGCDAMAVRSETSGSIPADACCYKLTLRNAHAPAGPLDGLMLTVLTPGTTFAAPSTGPWPVVSSTSTDVTFKMSSGSLASGQTAGEFAICLRNTGGQPGSIRLQWQSRFGATTVCTDTIDLDCHPISQDVCDSVYHSSTQSCRYNFGIVNHHRPQSPITSVRVRVVTPGASMSQSGLPPGWSVQTSNPRDMLFTTTTNAINPSASMSGFLFTFTPGPGAPNTVIEFCPRSGDSTICCHTITLACAETPPCDSLLIGPAEGECTFDLGFINRHLPASPINGFRVTVRTAGASIATASAPTDWMVESNTGPVVVFRDTGIAVQSGKQMRGFHVTFNRATGNPAVFFEWCSMLNGNVICCGTFTVQCQPQPRCDSLLVTKTDECTFDFGFINRHVPTTSVNGFHLSLPVPVSEILSATPPAGWRIDSLLTNKVIFRDTAGVIPINGSQTGFVIRLRQPFGGQSIPVQWCTSFQGQILCCSQTDVTCAQQTGRCDSLFISPAENDCSFNLGFANRRSPASAVNEFRVKVATAGASIAEAILPSGWLFVEFTADEFVARKTSGGVETDSVQAGYKVALSPPTGSGMILLQWCTAIDGKAVCCDSVIIQCAPRLLQFDSVLVETDTLKPCCFTFTIHNTHKPEGLIDRIRIDALDNAVRLLGSTVSGPLGWNPIILGNDVMWTTPDQAIFSGESLSGFTVCFDPTPSGRPDFDLAWRSYGGASLLSSDTVAARCESVLRAGPPESVLAAPVLYAGFPNPATHETRVRFDLPRRMPLQMTVFNRIGIEVMKVLDGTYEQGTHEVAIDTRRLPAGLYHYRLFAAGRVQTGTLVVIR